MNIWQLVYAYREDRWLILLSAVLISLLSHETAASEKAYLIIEAVFLPLDELQPDRIYVCGPKKCSHFPADGLVWEVDPGTYEFRHIDFSRENMFSFDVRYPDITLEEGHIYIYGRIEFKRRGVERARIMDPYDMALAIDIDLLKDACDANPDVFDLYPVVNIHNGSKENLTCN